MNSNQRRQLRRMVAPAVLKLIDGLNAAARHMEETGETMTPEECRSLADGLRAMLAADSEWEAIARRRETQQRSRSETPK